jgi:hypothetical protein
MKAYEYINFLVNSEAFQLAFKDVGDMSLNPTVTPTDEQVANQARFVSFLNLANIEVHKRFSLIKRDTTLDMAVAGAEYSMPTDYLNLISAYYSVDGDEVPINNEKKNVVEGVDRAVSVLSSEPFKLKIKGTDLKERTDIVATYAAAPKLLTKAAHDLNVPQVYTEAILNYAAYKAHSSVTGDIKAENNTYFMRYERSCKQIETFGLVESDNLGSNTKLEDNGFV